MADTFQVAGRSEAEWQAEYNAKSQRLGELQLARKSPPEPSASNPQPIPAIDAEIVQVNRELSAAKSALDAFNANRKAVATGKSEDQKEAELARTKAQTESAKLKADNDRREAAERAKNGGLTNKEAADKAAKDDNNANDTRRTDIEGVKVQTGLQVDLARLGAEARRDASNQAERDYRAKYETEKLAEGAATTITNAGITQRGQDMQANNQRMGLNQSMLSGIMSGMIQLATAKGKSKYIKDFVLGSLMLMEVLNKQNRVVMTDPTQIQTHATLNKVAGYQTGKPTMASHGEMAADMAINMAIAGVAVPGWQGPIGIQAKQMLDQDPDATRKLYSPDAAAAKGPVDLVEERRGHKMFSDLPNEDQVERAVLIMEAENRRYRGKPQPGDEAILATATDQDMQDIYTHLDDEEFKRIVTLGAGGKDLSDIELKYIADKFQPVLDARKDRASGVQPVTTPTAPTVEPPEVVPPPTTIGTDNPPTTELGQPVILPKTAFTQPGEMNNFFSMEPFPPSPDPEESLTAGRELLNGTTRPGERPGAFPNSSTSTVLPGWTQGEKLNGYEQTTRPVRVGGPYDGNILPSYGTPMQSLLDTSEPTTPQVRDDWWSRDEQERERQERERKEQERLRQLEVQYLTPNQDFFSY